MSCSVVIPCFNGAALTRACVASLLRQEGCLPTEILLVDNGSTDETGSLGDLAPVVRVLRQPENLGFAGGVNQGVRAATGELVLVLNNDTQAAPNLLAEMRRVLRSDTRIGACAPVSNHVKGNARLPVGDLGRDPGQRRLLAAELQTTAPPVQDVDTLAGLCLLLRRETLQHVGLFDERFGHGNFEDDDLSLRLRLAGYRLVLARRAFLHHEGHATFRAMGLELRDEMAQRLVQFHAKWHGHPAGYATLAAMQNQLSAAAAASLRAQRHCPRWPDADLHLGRFHEAAGNAELAATHLRAFLRQCPEHVDALVGLGLALLRTEAAEHGRQVLQTTVARHHLSDLQRGELLQRLGEIDYEHGHHQSAGQHFRDALELRPTVAELHNWLGLCLLADGDHTSAAAAFERAIEHGYPLAHTNLGICRHALGDRAAAARSFHEAVLLLPRDPIARANYEALRQRPDADQPTVGAGAAARSPATC